jgi:hypothetical protein
MSQRADLADVHEYRGKRTTAGSAASLPSCRVPGPTPPVFCSFTRARSAAGSSQSRSMPSSPSIAKSVACCSERDCLPVSVAAPARTCRPAPPIGPEQLIRDWRRALDAFGVALAEEKRHFAPAELKQLERHLADERRWLEHFASIRNFP